jgi:hypothetical protein
VKAVRTIAMWVGGIHLLLFVLGALNVIDFHVCVAGPGQCEVKLNVSGPGVMRFNVGGAP